MVKLKKKTGEELLTEATAFVEKTIDQLDAAAEKLNEEADEVERQIIELQDKSDKLNGQYLQAARMKEKFEQLLY